MKQPEALLCESCKKLPATVDSVQPVLAVCENCHERLVIQDAYESRLAEVYNLSNQGNLQAALKILNDLRSTYIEKDRDGWLDFSLGSDAAMILRDNSLYDQALDWHRKLALDHTDRADRVIPNQLGMAIVLDKMGNWREALAALDHGLTSITDDTASDALGLLWWYIKIATPQQQQVPEHYKNIFDQVIRRCGLQIQVDLLAEPHSLAHAIVVGYAQWREANTRFKDLRRALRGKKTKDELLEIVDDYCRNEPVGHFRELARRVVENDTESGEL